MTTRDRLRRTAFVLAVLACLGGIGYAGTRTREIDPNGDEITAAVDDGDVAVSGDEALFRTTVVDPNAPAEPGLVEQTIPAEGAEILQQQQIGIDLRSGFRVARFYVDGTLLEDTELIRREELNQTFFQPGEDFTFEVLPPGRVCARVDVVTALDGEAVRSVDWCFQVT